MRALVLLAAVAVLSALLPAQAAAGAPGPWRCLQVPGGTASPLPRAFANIVVRLAADGNPECASEDGRRCVRNSLPDTCLPWERQQVDRMPILKPLRCGEQHWRARGFTGYDTRDHWCTPAKKALVDLATCQPRASAAGLPCASDACCKSGACRPNPSNASRGDAPKLCACGSAKDCSARSACLGGACVLKLYTGERPPAGAGAAAACLSGAAGQDGRCTCQVDSHCPPGGYCEKPGATKCAALRLFGAACSSGRQCFTQRCIGGACADCRAQADCPQGLKCNATSRACFHGDLPLRLPCKSGADCRQSGACVRGACLVCKSSGDCAASPQYRVRWQCRLAADPFESTCQPVAGSCFADSACGVAPSEDDWAADGVCHAKACLQCGRAGAWHRRVAGPMDVSTEGPRLFCNMETNRFF